MHTEELHAPEGAAGAAEDMPVLGFCDADSDGALVGCVCQQEAGRWPCANFTVKILVLLSRVSHVFSGTPLQLMDQKGCQDQAFLSISFLHSGGLLAACCSHWAKHPCVTVLPLIDVRLA